MTAEDRFWSKVTKTDTCWEWSGAINRGGYGVLSYNGKAHRAHRLAYELSVSAIPEGFVIDHTCYVKACVRPSHLRAITAKQNQENRAGAQARSKSGVRGVYWNKASSKWHAQVCHERHVYYAGSYASLADAEAAAAAKRNELFTHNDVDRRQ